MTVIGDNGGPVLDVWSGIKAHADDLLEEAHNWADGEPILNQSQADAVGLLRSQLQAISKDADAARIEEKLPYDEIIAEIQDRYNVYIAPVKNKHPGKISKAIAALGNQLTAWLNKVEDDRRERERIAAAEAAAAAQIALDAHQAARSSTDLAQIEAAEYKIEDAERLLKQAKYVAAEKVQVRGESRNTGLRSYWTASMVEGGGKAALGHYLSRKPERVKEFLLVLANEDVRSGARSIPGFNVIEEKRV